MIEAPKLQPWDTMSLIKAGLWFGVCSVSMGAISHTFTHPKRANPLSPLHEPLHWRAKRDPKANMLSLQIPSTERRVVGICWEHLKPNGPKGSESKNAFSAVLSTEGRGVGLCWEKLKPKGPKGSERCSRLWPFPKGVQGCGPVVVLGQIINLSLYQRS